MCQAVSTALPKSSPRHRGHAPPPPPRENSDGQSFQRPVIRVRRYGSLRHKIVSVYDREGQAARLALRRTPGGSRKAPCLWEAAHFLNKHT